MKGTGGRGIIGSKDWTRKIGQMFYGEMETDRLH